jgi:pimeloyl-ACP methyl ester carboxylesterase
VKRAAECAVWATVSRPSGGKSAVIAALDAPADVDALLLDCGPPELWPAWIGIEALVARDFASMPSSGAGAGELSPAARAAAAAARAAAPAGSSSGSGSGGGSGSSVGALRIADIHRAIDALSVAVDAEISWRGSQKSVLHPAV